MMDTGKIWLLSFTTVFHIAHLQSSLHPLLFPISLNSDYFPSILSTCDNDIRKGQCQISRSETPS